MGYTVSIKVKPLDNQNVGRSIAHDFRTAFTVNVRNNKENSVINIVDGSSINFRANDNLINQNLKYKFHENGNRLYNLNEIDEDIDISFIDEEEMDFINETENKVLKKEITDAIFDKKSEAKQNSKNLNKNKQGQILFKNLKSQTEKEIENIKDIYQKDMGRSMHKATKFYQEALIMFGADTEERNKRDFIEDDIKGLTDTEIENINTINRESMDKSAADFFKNFEVEQNVKVMYLVRHDDEKTCHYQAIFTNFDYEKKRALGMDRRKITAFNQNLQDKVFESFQDLEFKDKSLNIARGKKKLGYADIKDKTQKQQDELHDNKIRLNNLFNSMKQLDILINSKEDKLIDIETEYKNKIKTINNSKNTASSLQQQIDTEESKLEILKEQFNTIKKSRIDVINMKQEFSNKLNNTKNQKEKEEIINVYFNKINQIKFKELDNLNDMRKRNIILENTRDTLNIKIKDLEVNKIKIEKKLYETESKLQKIVNISKNKIQSFNNTIQLLKQKLDSKIKDINILEKYSNCTLAEIKKEKKLPNLNKLSR